MVYYRIINNIINVVCIIDIWPGATAHLILFHFTSLSNRISVSQALRLTVSQDQIQDRFKAKLKPHGDGDGDGHATIYQRNEREKGHTLVCRHGDLLRK
jgi:hypothetical protein